MPPSVCLTLHFLLQSCFFVLVSFFIVDFDFSCGYLTTEATGTFVARGSPIFVVVFFCFVP